jgi:hypothetical protein
MRGLVTLADWSMRVLHADLASEICRSMALLGYGIVSRSTSDCPEGNTQQLFRESTGHGSDLHMHFKGLNMWDKCSSQIVDSVDHLSCGIIH